MLTPINSKQQYSDCKQFITYSDLQLGSGRMETIDRNESSASDIRHTGGWADVSKEGLRCCLAGSKPTARCAATLDAGFMTDTLS